MVAPLHVGWADIGGKSGKNPVIINEFPSSLHRVTSDTPRYGGGTCTADHTPPSHPPSPPFHPPADAVRNVVFWRRFQESSMIKVNHARSDADLFTTNHGPITRSRISLIELSTFQILQLSMKRWMEPDTQHLLPTSSATFPHGL